MDGKWFRLPEGPRQYPYWQNVPSLTTRSIASYIDFWNYFQTELEKSHIFFQTNILLTLNFDPLLLYLQRSRKQS